jgi:DNA-directed RNA polymerase subunit RPC12/RpoP
MNAVDHKCPNCHAYLNYNPTKEKWVCEYCDSIFELSDLNQNNENFEKEVVKIDGNVYRCPNCKAEIVTDVNTSATKCVYCGNTAILKDKLVGDFAPDMIIPFKKSKEDAIEAFKKVTHNKPFAPDEFNLKRNINNITGIYIPFWAFDYDVTSKTVGIGKKVKQWTRGDYRYTKTDEFSVVREGNISFEKIPNDGSVRFDDAVMNSIEPFDYSGLTEFNASYLSGFLSEKYDVSKEDGNNIAYERAKNSAYKALEDTIIGYSSYITDDKSTSITNTKAYYILLPVWMLNIKYKDEIYTFAMNGQTGKMIGDVPIDKNKRKIVFIKNLIFMFAILVVIYYLLAKGGIV